MDSQASPRQVRILALAPAPGAQESTAALGPNSEGIALLRLQLFGRYLLLDGKSYPCRTLIIDPNQIALSCEVNGSPGDRIDLDLDLLGVLHGVIEARMAAGLRVNVGENYQDHIAQKLAWFKACLGYGPADMDFAPTREKRAQRIIPLRPECMFVDADGGSHTAKIINISRSGAAIRTSYRPTVGAPILLGRDGRRGLTVRCFEDGFAIAFLELISPAQFGHHMII